MSAHELVFAEVNRDTWRDFERLFESRGAPSYCWCMAWRAQGEEVKRTDRASRKRAMERRVRSSAPVGLLAYRDGEPIAWASIAPRETYRPLGGPDDGSGPVWSLVCFYVPRSLRRQGVMERLIQASVEHARARGAAVVEAYPVDPDSPSYRYMGFVPVFERAGFEHVDRAGTRRHVMRLRVGDRPGDGARREPRGEARSD